jgi:Cu+-exporting ATPase
VTTVEVTSGSTEDDLMRLAAAVEHGSAHPLAAAIVNAAVSRGIQIPPVSDFVSTAGKGVSGRVEGRRVDLGNLELLKARGIDPGELAVRADLLRRAGQTVLLVAVDDRAIGLVAAADPIRPDGRSGPITQRRWPEGDHADGDADPAAAIASRLGIEDVRSEVLPNEKREVVAELQRNGELVAMAGDGINDAPALAQATVGIAMGTGTDVAMESAGITLVKSDLRGIVRARRLSRATLRNIRQNLFLAFIYNIVGVPVAAGVLYPFFGLLISPIWASAAMTLSSLSVIGNALACGASRCRGRDPRPTCLLRPAEPIAYNSKQGK